MKKPTKAALLAALAYHRGGQIEFDEDYLAELPKDLTCEVVQDVGIVRVVATRPDQKA